MTLQKPGNSASHQLGFAMTSSMGKVSMPRVVKKDRKSSQAPLIESFQCYFLGHGIPT